MVAFLVLKFKTLRTFDLITCLRLQIIRAGDDQFHPVRSRGQRRCVIGCEIFRTERIKVRGLIAHCSAQLCLKVPFDGGRTIRLEGPFDLDRKNRARTTRDAGRLRVHVHRHIGYFGIRRFNNRDGS